MKEINFQGKKVFVSGATGFVGSHLTERLLAQGAQVTLLVRETSNARAVDSFRQKGARLIFGDVRDFLAVLKATTGTELVFHVAALFREAKFADQVYFDVNVQGTKNILDAAKQTKVTRVIHCSTNGVHGGLSGSAVDETAPFAPSDLYQRSKCDAELVVKHYVEEGYLEAVILRPAMIWGEGDRRFLKFFRGIAHRRLPIIGTGMTWTHWIYVHDLVDAFFAAAITPQANGQAYLIAGKKPVLLREVYSTIAELAGVKVLPFRIPAKPLQLAGSLVELLLKPFPIEPPLHRRRVDFFVKHRCFNIAKATAELGFQPRLDFREEARNIYQWYAEQGWL